MKFSLKRMFFIVLGFAIAFTLYGVFSEPIGMQNRALKQITEAGGSYELVDDDTSNTWVPQYVQRKKFKDVLCNQCPNLNPELLASLGYVERLLCCDNPNLDFAWLSEIDGLRAVALTGSSVHDLDWIRPGNQIEHLNFGSADMKDITDLKHCNHLDTLFVYGLEKDVALPDQMMTVEILLLSDSSFRDLRWLKGMNPKQLSLYGSDFESLDGLDEADNLS